ncbi:MAG: hypothetical protein AB8F74_16310 [Saprospiraceae bacterium]
MTIISYSEALKALDTYVKNYNDRCASLRDRIKQSTIATAKDLIRLYGLELRKIKYNPEFVLPPLRTNNRYLAKVGNTSSRTIQRHIKRLQVAGIIIQKKWRGSRASYDIHLLPELLCITAPKTVQNNEKDKNVVNQNTSNNQILRDSKTTICPHRDTSNNSYINNIIIAVDKLRTDNNSLPLALVSKSRNATGNSLTRYTGEIAPKEYENAGETARDSRVKKQTGAEILEPDVARAVSLNNYADKLWAYAFKELYTETPLTDGQIKTAKRLLLKWYEPVAEANLELVHQVYLQRIDIVRRYVEKDSHRFVQLPNRFFDPNNPSGFTGTKSWYQKALKQNRKSQEQLALKVAILKFKNNEKLDTALQQPRLAMFLNCEKSVKALNKPDLLNLFYKSVAEFI